MTTNSTKETLVLLDKLINEKVTFGSMIANIRECEEMSQTAFAKILGVSRHYLCDVEHDRKNVSAVMAYEYAKKLGYSTKQFVQLAIQGQMDRAGIDLIVDISARKRSKLKYKNATL